MLERVSGVTPEQLEPMPFPFETGYLWGWFNEMCGMRAANGMAVSRLSAEILTWQSLRHIELTTFELETIWLLDAIFVSHHNRKAQKND